MTAPGWAFTPAVAELKLAELLATGSRILGGAGHDDMNQGQISARMPRADRFVIKSAVRSFAEAAPGDMTGAHVDPDESLPRLAPPETSLHQAIYAARPDVGAIVHSHAPWTLVFGAFDLELRPISHDAAWFRGAVSRFTLTSNTILDIGTARDVAGALGDGRAALLRNHGGVVVGPSIREAVVGALVLERACQLQLMAESVGRPWHESSDDDVAAKRDFVWAPRSVRTYWDALARSVQSPVNPAPAEGRTA